MARKQVVNRAVTAEPLETVALPTAEPVVTVRARGWIGEDGVTYKPGDTWQTTAKRAAALGGNVEIVSANG